MIVKHENRAILVLLLITFFPFFTLLISNQNKYDNDCLYYEYVFVFKCTYIFGQITKFKLFNSQIIN